MLKQAFMLGAVALLVGTAAAGGGPRTKTIYLRGKELQVRIYDPPAGAPGAAAAPGAAGAPRRNLDVLVASGDLGWLGISGDLPPYLQARGYRVVALNVQQYLVAFTGGKGPQLTDEDVAHDFGTIMEAVDVDSVAPPPFVYIGVSEGASLAVMAAGQAGAHPLCRGVIGLGLPMESEMAFRWTDFPSWITKAEPHEPLAPTLKYLEQLRAPLVVIHSIHDEYDNIDTVRAAVARAPVPKRFLAVDAPNHRFSHRTRQVLAMVDSSLVWLDSLRAVAPRAHNPAGVPAPR